MKHRKWMSLLLSIVMVAALLAGCGGGAASSAAEAPKEEAPAESKEEQKEEAPAEEQKEEASEEEAAEEPAGDAGENVLHLAASGTNFNETQSGFASTSRVGDAGLLHGTVLETLLMWDVDAEAYVNKLAEKVEHNDDCTVWTVTLKDATFHDGTPVTAEDVVFSYNYGANVGRRALIQSLVGIDRLGDASAGQEADVEGIKALDDKTVEFTLVQGDSQFEYALAHDAFSIMPKHAFTAESYYTIPDDPYWSNPIGTGPYCIDETHFPDYVTLKTYDGYYGAAPGIPAIRIQYYTDSESIYAAVMNGEVDTFTVTSMADAENIKANNPDIDIEVLPSLLCRYLFVNCTGAAGADKNDPYNKSLTNPRVRQALNMLIDKESIVDLFDGISSVATTLTNSERSEYNTDIPKWERDVEGAKAILDEENFDYSTPIRIHAYYTDQITVDVLDLIVQNLNEVGIQASYYVDQPNTAIITENLEYDMKYAAYSVYFPIESYNLYTEAMSYHTHLDQEKLAAGYYKQTYDDVIAKWHETSDPAEQKACIDAVQASSMEDMCVIPLFNMNTVKVYNNRLTCPKYSRDFETTVDPKYDQWKIG